MARYKAAKDGEWIQPVRNGYLMACCDCGLVHEINFRVKKRKIQFQATRDNRKTAAKRRHLKPSNHKV